MTTVEGSAPTQLKPKPLPPEMVAGRVYSYCFVTGAQKSGTTWVGWMLRAHPQIAVRGEAGYLGNPDDATTWVHGEALERFLSQPNARRLLEHVPAERVLAAAQRGMVESLLRLSCEPDEHTRVLGDRAPHAYLLGLDRLHALFPDAVFVDVVRDGRDVAVSNAFMMLRNRKWNEKSYASLADAEAAHAAHIEGRGEAPLFGAGQLDHYASRWAFCVAAGERARELFGDRYIRLRYEQMLGDPALHARVLFERLGVEADEQTVHACVRAASFERKSGGRQPGEADPGSFVRKGVAGDWVNYFREEDRAIFNRHGLDALVRLGYAPGAGW